MKVGLVLEGGGMRGLYTAGVLDAFLEAGIKVDGVVSVSAGALFGVNYLSNQPKRALRYNKRFMGDRRYMSFWSWLTTGNFVNKEFSYYKVPMELDVFDQDAFAESGVPFYVVATDIKTGKPDYIKIDHVFEQMEALRASSALPLVSEIENILLKLASASTNSFTASILNLLRLLQIDIFTTIRALRRLRPWKNLEKSMPFVQSMRLKLVDWKRTQKSSKPFIKKD